MLNFIATAFIFLESARVSKPENGTTHHTLIFALCNVFGASDEASFAQDTNFVCMESGLMKMTNIMHKQIWNCVPVRTS